MARERIVLEIGHARLMPRERVRRLVSMTAGCEASQSV